MGVVPLSQLVESFLGSSIYLELKLPVELELWILEFEESYGKEKVRAFCRPTTGYDDWGGLTCEG